MHLASTLTRLASLGLLTDDDSSLYVVNNAFAPAPLASLVLRAELLALNGSAIYNTTQVLGGGALRADGVLQLEDGVPSPAAVALLLGPHAVYFVRLTLIDSAAVPAAVVEENSYWLSTTEDVLDWDNSTWYNTPCSAYADLSQLLALPRISLAVDATTNVTLGSTAVQLTNPATAAGVAFFIRVRLLGATGVDIAVSGWNIIYSKSRC